MVAVAVWGKLHCNDDEGGNGNQMQGPFLCLGRYPVLFGFGLAVLQVFLQAQGSDCCGVVPQPPNLNAGPADKPSHRVSTATKPRLPLQLAANVMSPTHSRPFTVNHLEFSCCCQPAAFQ